MSHSELQTLLIACIEGTCNEVQFQELDRLLQSDPIVQAAYIDLMFVHTSLEWRYSAKRWHRAPSRTQQQVEEPVEDDMYPRTATAIPGIASWQRDNTAPPAFVVDGSSATSPNRSFFGASGVLLSYAVALVIVTLGLVVGSLWYVQSHEDNLAGRTASSDARDVPPELHFVGKVTGAVACQWTAPSTAAELGASIPLGKQLSLVSGLLEITHDGGAKVLLEGPCNYEVDGRASGFLAFGKLAAKVEKRAGGRGQAVLPSSSVSSPSPLFAVRTPTTIVTDLGTEFGVEVEKSGTTRTHVYQGRVEVERTNRPKGSPRRAVVLGPNESARVEPVSPASDKEPEIQVNRDKLSPNTFVRQLPKRMPIKLFNTGKGLKPGDQDPHWQIVARSDDPNVAAQPARAWYPKDLWLPSDPARSTWITDSSGIVPNEVTFTFRTSFDLSGMQPTSATISGHFLVDDMIVGVRLNGRDLPIPKHDWGITPMVRWWPIVITQGFVDGINVLEVDVKNTGFSNDKTRGMQDPNGFMGFRMELGGSAFSMAAWPEHDVRKTPASVPPRERR